MPSRIWKEAWLGESGGEALNGMAGALDGSPPHLEQENPRAEAQRGGESGEAGKAASHLRARPGSPTQRAWGLLWPGLRLLTGWRIFSVYPPYLSVF